MPVTPQPQKPTQNSFLLTKLPRELRDMIYGQVFADVCGFEVPHPLTQTSKQLREEVMPVAASDIASRATLTMSCRPCSRDHQMDTIVTMDGPDRLCCTRPVRLYIDKRSPPYPSASLSWRDLCCGEFGKQLIPHMRRLRIFIQMEHLHEIIVRFSKSSAPEITMDEENCYNRKDIEFRGMCLSIAERFEEKGAACSAEWVDAFMRDIVDAWFILVSGV